MFSLTENFQSPQRRQFLLYLFFDTIYFNQQKTNRPSKIPSKSESNPLLLIKKKTSKQEDFNLEPFNEEAFLMKYKFVPPQTKILNIFTTSNATFLHTSQVNHL